MYILQFAPAETTSYMIAGYSVIFGMLLGYIASLYLRTRNLKRDLETLKDVGDSDLQRH
jgi:hypothetical protein